MKKVYGDITHCNFLAVLSKQISRIFGKRKQALRKIGFFYLSSDPPIIKLIRRNPPPHPPKHFLGWGRGGRATCEKAPEKSQKVFRSPPPRSLDPTATAGGAKEKKGKSFFGGVSPISWEGGILLLLQLLPPPPPK